MVDPTQQLWLMQGRQGESLGPYSLQQLCEFASHGELNQTTMVKNTQSDHWVRAEQVPYIFANVTRGESTTQPANAGWFPHGQMLPRAVSSRIKSTSPLMLVIVSLLAFCFVGMILLLLLLLDTMGEQKNSNADYSETSDDLFSTTTRSSDVALTSVYTTEELVSNTKRSIVMVVAGSGDRVSLGSGFVVDKDVVATNYHVVEGADRDSIAIYFPDGDPGEEGPHSARLMAKARDNDLALLRVKSNMPPLPLAKQYRFRKGQDVVIIGSPGLFDGQGVLPNAVTKGVLSSETDQLGGKLHYQLSMAVNPGNSGGPVLGMDGKVLGVVVAKSTTEEAIGFCVPISELQDLLRLERSLFKE